MFEQGNKKGPTSVAVQRVSHGQTDDLQGRRLPLKQPNTLVGRQQTTAAAEKLTIWVGWRCDKKKKGGGVGTKGGGGGRFVGEYGKVLYQKQNRGWRAW